MLMKILQETAKKKLINTLEYKPELCINCVLWYVQHGLPSRCIQAG
jgi:hypothetical protein